MFRLHSGDAHYTGVQMKTKAIHMPRSLAVLALMAGLTVSSVNMSMADTCFTAGQKLAASQGATLVGAEAASQDGKPVCKVIMLVPDASGGRPKREVIFVDQ